jgi:hypothetical protein
MELPSYHKEIKDIKWHKNWRYHLVPSKGNISLLDEMDISDCREKIIIAREYKIGDTPLYKFTWFDSVEDFCNYRKIHKNELLEVTFNETIVADKGFKLYFDLDIDYDSCEYDHEDVLSIIIEAIIQILERFEIDDFKNRKKKKIKINLSKDIRIHTSHGMYKGKKKISYLVVIDNYFVMNYIVAAYVYKLVKEQLKKNGYEMFIKYIDNVYKKIQNIRCLGSVKCGDKRERILLKKWTYKEEEIVLQEPEGDNDYEKKINEYERSFVTNLYYGKTYCKQLLISVPLEIKKNYPEIELDDDMISDAIDKLEKSDLIDINAFDFDGNNMNGNLLPLIRKPNYPSYCCICDREHDRTNQYLIITDKVIILGCFRAPRGQNTKYLYGKKSTKIKIGEDELPSHDPYWERIIEGNHDGHAEVFLEIVNGKYFQTPADKGMDIFEWTDNKALWKNIDYPTFSDRVQKTNKEFIKDWIIQMREKWLYSYNKVKDKKKNENNKKDKENNGIEFNRKKQIKKLFDDKLISNLGNN